MLQHAIDSWASIYANHAVLRTTIEFLHVGGLLGAGGAAIAADRAALTPHRPDLADWLDSFHATHRIVLSGIGVILASGVLLLAADVDTYFYSKVFWTKMGMFVLLLLNGAQLVRTETAARSGDERAHARLRTLAGVSLALWFLITLAGAALPNIS
ncbi:MAG TPA: hypothetical protein VGL62_11225 [Vicinamibacterales bacterium]|jgi:uncharacterized membrane protein